MNRLVLLIALGCSVSLIQGQSGPVVTTDYGAVEGYDLTTNGFNAQAFLGVPYAAPPVGDLRYEKSIPPTPWTITRQAKAFPPVCASISAGSEDCLYLNIIRPTTPSSDPNGYPVLVWIHGGAYYIGSTADYPVNETAARIVSKGVIFVSANYRQGGFGFFSTGPNSTFPGNYGIWDQVQALKFIQQEISKFGGNPNDVTIYGQSAGGTISSWLALSPLTKTLFKRVIESSGTAVFNRGLIPTVAVQSNNLIGLLNCTSAVDVKACVKSKTVLEIQNAWRSLGGGIFLPVYDGELMPNEKVEKLALKAKKREIFIGGNSMEYNVFALTTTQVGSYPITAAKAANFTQQDFEDIVRNAIATPAKFGNKSTEVAQKIIDFYLGQTGYAPELNFYLQLYVQLVSDFMFNVPLVREAKLYALTGHKVRVYLYDYVPPAYQSYYAYNQLFAGAGHSSELWNLFGNAFAKPNVPLVGDAGAVQTTFTDLWTNFAKNGKATSGTLKTPRVFTPLFIPYIEIKPNSTIKANLFPDRVHFWNKLARDYGYDWPESRTVNKHHLFDDINL